MSPSHVPALDAAQLEIALQALDRLNIPAHTKQQLRLILIAAANGNSDTVEASIASLPPDRQQLIAEILQQVQNAHSSIADRAGALLLLLLGAVGLLAALHEAFSMKAADIALQTEQLLQARQRIWLQAIADEARAAGVNKAARFPSGADLDRLRQMSEDDATSIASTYNKDLERQIERLRKANPNGDRAYYVESLRVWARERAGWKAAQVALNTETNTREYTRRRFWEMNGLTDRRFIATGPTPVCAVCIGIFGAGIVSYAYTRAHPLPAHMNCPHWYRLQRKAKLDAARAWMG